MFWKRPERPDDAKTEAHLFSRNGMYLTPFAVGPGPPDFVIAFHVPVL